MPNTDTDTTLGPDLLDARHLAAVLGLADPPPLDPAVDPDVDHDARMPAASVAVTLAGVTAVLTALGMDDVINATIPTALRVAAGRGAALRLRPRLAKALWVFCDAFVDREPRLAGARRGLRVHQV